MAELYRLLCCGGNLITTSNDYIIAKETYLTSKSEFEWNGDKKWGTGDYRLPKQMTTALDGTNISPDKWKYKGIDRDSNVNILLTNITTALSYHRVRGLYRRA